MSYTALYRKLRPTTFEDVIGQTHITKTLVNQMKSDRISHAYLFCGTRGTGKTSTAKIFARAINCEATVDGSPCNSCQVCKSIMQGYGNNVIEIDAASNNGVENIRDIREEVKYPPTEGKYKVYIIDEVHMLSTSAFNALLKTLEEPPEHVIFILATTDPQKIPATILSRCQRFDFKRIQTKTMVDSIKTHLKEEEINITDDALEYIAYLSDGAMRDALSILDQCSAFYLNEEINLDKVLKILGAVDSQVFFDMTDYIFLKDSTNCINTISKIMEDGRDITQFVQDLLVHLRNLLVVNMANNSGGIINLSSEKIEKLKEQGKKINTQLIIEYINAFSNLESQLKYATNPKIFLEVECIRLCTPQVLESAFQYENRLENLENNSKKNNSQIDNEYLKRLDYLEQKLENISALNVNTNIENGQNLQQEKPVVYKQKAVSDDNKKVIGQWASFTDGFSSAFKAILKKSAPATLEGDMLYIVTDEIASVAFLRDKERPAQIKERLAKVYNKDFDVDFIVKDEYNKRHKMAYGIVDNETESFFNMVKSKLNIDVYEE